jgi:hypothetical protein
MNRRPSVQACWLRTARSVLLLLGVLFISSAVALRAQEQGTILGTVTDQSGGVVPGANITITNQATGAVQRTATTNSAGNYLVAGLPVSTYTVKCEKQGFKTASHTDLALNVRSEVRVDFTMAVGEVSVEVNVVASSVHLQTENAVVSDTITAHHVEALDINGRNFIQLTTLVPGASGQSLIGSVNLPVGVTSNVGVNFNGLRQAHNVFSVDGVDNYDRGCGGCIEVIPDQDAIQEFKVSTSNATQDLGFGSGGRISMEIKGGTNRFHGEVFAFNRNRYLEAGQFFLNKAGKTLPYDNQNDYGFNLGGPIGNPAKENKTFFFVTLNWRRFIQGLGNNVNGIYTPWTTGDFSDLSLTNNHVILDKSQAGVACTDATGAAQTCYPQITDGETPNVIPAAMLDPNASILANPSVGVFLPPNSGARRIEGYSSPIKVDEDIIRIDHQFSERTSLMAHYIRDNVNQTVGKGLWVGQSYPDVQTLFLNEPESIALKVTHSISSTLLNEAMVAFNRQPLTLIAAGVVTLPSGTTIQKLFPGNDPLNRIPQIGIGGGIGVTYTTGSWAPWYNVLNTWTWRDSLTMIRGNHTMNFGFEDLHYMKQQRLFGNTNGAYNFDGSATQGYYLVDGVATKTDGNPFADFMLGRAQSYTEMLVQPTPAWMNNHIGLWFGDSWKARPGLTLNLAMRWEGMPHAYERHNEVAVFRPSLYDPATAAAQYDAAAGNFGGNYNILGKPFYLNGMGSPNPNFNLPSVQKGLVQNHWNLFEPRVGFAWQPRASGKLVIRAGGGLYYENIQGNDVYGAGANPPAAANANILNTSFTNPAGGTLPAGSPGTLQTFEPHYFQPNTWQWNFGGEYQINSRTMFSLSYVGNKSTHQQINHNINQPLPSATPYNADNGYPGGINQARPYLGWSTISTWDNNANANYNSLQANLRFSSWHGLTTGAAYTYSHCLDYVDNDNAGNTPNNYNLAREYGHCGFDIRHMLMWNYIYTIPFFNQAAGAKRTLLGGWQVSGITSLYSGQPLTIGTTQSDSQLANCNCGGYRANVTGNPNNGPKTVDQWFDTSVFAPAQAGTFGNSARNIVRGAGIANFDFSVFKNFAGIPLPRTKEGGSLQLRFEFYNGFNHTQFNAYSTSVGAGDFGHVTGARLPRQIQIAAKFTF